MTDSPFSNSNESGTNPPPTSPQNNPPYDTVNETRGTVVVHTEEKTKVTMEAATPVSAPSPSVASELPPLPGEMPYDPPFMSAVSLATPPISPSAPEHQSPTPGAEEPEKKPEEKKPQSSESAAKITVVIILIILFALGIIIPLVIVSRTFFKIGSDIASSVHVQPATSTTTSAENGSSTPLSTATSTSQPKSTNGFMAFLNFFGFLGGSSRPASTTQSSASTTSNQNQNTGTTTIILVGSGSNSTTSVPVTMTSASSTPNTSQPSYGNGTSASSANTNSNNSSYPTNTPSSAPTTPVRPNYPDLSVRITGLGTTNTNNTFVPASYVPNGSPIAIEFVVTNNGGVSSGLWSLSATLPSTTNPSYSGLDLTSLAPGASATYILSFSNPTPGNNYISITAKAANDANSTNNSASALMQAQQYTY